MVDCPKCTGAGEFRHFAHIANGRCFLCGGAKSVTKAKAGRWISAQIRGDMALARQATADEPPAPAAPPRPTKEVRLPGFGRVRIVRLRDGRFSVDVSDPEAGAIQAWFVVEDARVRVTKVTNGLADRRQELQRALQAALRA